MDKKAASVIVVGGGPAGVSCAWFAAKTGASVTLVDAHPTIGGCHRVKRVDGKFGEHGPRIYSTSYVCVHRLLEDMGLKFADYFAPYEFGISNIAKKNMDMLSFREKLAFGKAAIFGPEPISVAEFCKRNNFSAESTDYLNRLCRLTDGAGSDRYPIKQLIDIVNSQSLYTLMQPSRALDRKFWPDVQAKLASVGVKIFVSTVVTGIIVDSKERLAKGILMQDISGAKKLGDNPNVNIYSPNAGETKLFADTIYMCIPPSALLRTLGNRKMKKYFGVNKKWVRATKYERYINVTFMWARDVMAGVKRVWGFPWTKWGVAFIVLTDTMRGENFKTIISATPTKLPAKFNVDNYTSTEFATEILNQIRISYDHLPEPDAVSVEIPEPFEDTAYVAAVGTLPMPPRGYIKNLFALGPHNGHGEYTSMESAVSNVMHFFGEDCPKLWQLKHLLLILIVIVSAIGGYILWKRRGQPGPS